jgi:hypothetical protein
MDSFGASLKVSTPDCIETFQQPIVGASPQACQTFSTSGGAVPATVPGQSTQRWKSGRGAGQIRVLPPHEGTCRYPLRAYGSAVGRQAHAGALDAAHGTPGSSRGAEEGFGAHPADQLHPRPADQQRVIVETGPIDAPEHSPEGLRERFGVSAVSDGEPLHARQKWTGQAKPSTVPRADAMGRAEQGITARQSYDRAISREGARAARSGGADLRVQRITGRRHRDLPRQELGCPVLASGGSDR